MKIDEFRISYSAPQTMWEILFFSNSTSKYYANKHYIKCATEDWLKVLLLKACSYTY